MANTELSILIKYTKYKYESAGHANQTTTPLKQPDYSTLKFTIRSKSSLQESAIF